MNAQYDYLLRSSRINILNRTLHDHEGGGTTRIDERSRFTSIIFAVALRCSF